MLHIWRSHFLLHIICEAIPTRGKCHLQRRHAWAMRVRVQALRCAGGGVAYLRYPRTRLDHQPVRREQRLRHSWHARSSARECGCARQQRWDQLQLLHKYKCETQIRNGRERGKDTPKRRLMACVWPKLQAACKALLPSLPACRQSTSTQGSLSSQFNSRMTPAFAARHKRVLMAVLVSRCIQPKHITNYWQL